LAKPIRHHAPSKKPNQKVIMRNAPKSAPATDPARKQAVIYARAPPRSRRRKEGFSIPAQLELLKEYPA